MTTAADAIAAGYRALDSLPIEEAARAALTPTGPSLDRLVALIAARRGIALEASA